MIHKTLLLKFGSTILSFQQDKIRVISLILSSSCPFQFIPVTSMSYVCMLQSWSICLISDCFFFDLLMSGEYFYAIFYVKNCGFIIVSFLSVEYCGTLLHCNIFQFTQQWMVNIGQNENFQLFFQIQIIENHAGFYIKFPKTNVITVYKFVCFLVCNYTFIYSIAYFFCMDNSFAYLPRHVWFDSLCLLPPLEFMPTYSYYLVMERSWVFHTALW